MALITVNVKVVYLSNGIKRTGITTHALLIALQSKHAVKRNMRMQACNKGDVLIYNKLS